MSDGPTICRTLGGNRWKESEISNKTRLLPVMNLTVTVSVRPRHKLKWRHCNLWSQCDLYVVGQHGVLCDVKWWR